MASSDEVLNDNNTKLIDMIPNFLNPFAFFTKLLTLQVEIISTTVLSLSSPFLSIFSFVSNFLTGRAAATRNFQKQDDEQPSAAAAAGIPLLGRIAAGLLAATYVCVVLMMALSVAAVLGVGLVSSWAEEPVYVREGLQFDYSEAHPTAVSHFGGKAAAAAAAPVGHTLYVSLVLVMPESDYNRDLGIFQLSAELVSGQGEIVAKSSHPCMLRFRSWPIRLTRTFLIGIPLLLSITTETQTINFPILKHKETSSHTRTEYIRITMMPRSGTTALPQLYQAEVVVTSRPPWIKEFVHKWKLTFSVWTTMYIFMLLVVLLVSFLKPLIFPVMGPRLCHERDLVPSESGQQEPSEMARTRDEREVSASEKRWKHGRSKRKAALLHVMETESGPATSISVSQGAGCEEGSGDDSSVSVSFYKGEE